MAVDVDEFYELEKKSNQNGGGMFVRSRKAYYHLSFCRGSHNQLQRLNTAQVKVLLDNMNTVMLKSKNNT